MYFCVVDTETTGLKSDYHEIIEISVIICDDKLNEVARKTLRLHPQNIERASAKALEINGYNVRSWNPDFYKQKDAWEHLSKFFYNIVGDESVMLVGQNVNFDKDFILDAYKRVGLDCPFELPSVDLIKVAKCWSKIKNVKVKKFSLANLAEISGVVNENPHSAEADTETTISVLKWFVEEIKKESKNVKRTASKKTKITIR